MTYICFLILTLQRDAQKFQADREQREYLYRIIVKQIEKQGERTSQIKIKMNDIR